MRAVAVGCVRLVRVVATTFASCSTDSRSPPLQHALSPVAALLHRPVSVSLMSLRTQVTRKLTASHSHLAPVYQGLAPAVLVVPFPTGRSLHRTFQRLRNCICLVLARRGEDVTVSALAICQAVVRPRCMGHMKRS
ncbi:uncharacterized protein C8Q71DRAFT_761610 [Rhodofomes roseus]|uniref:Secreted protein n=1 Tax=Rhodofomes roseus TaxID=34475 RepID=A0ABQ8KEX6_9APHY|nr:uncharacterized protein C8Q71DRAFT_761610 [Rhodofomes roseus]KAH9836287.1 hypothetical protein C8Q71DRAFT_761610 [Rhodofomes roseus]